MKKFSLAVLAFIFIFSACKKNAAIPGSSTFSASVNSQPFTFKVFGASIGRSRSFNEKRLDISGISTDSSKKLVFTIFEQTAIGQGITVKTYAMVPTTDGLTPVEGIGSLIIASNPFGWAEPYTHYNGTFTITKCDTINHLLSGTFQIGFSNSTDTVSVTNGVLQNVKYNATTY